MNNKEILEINELKNKKKEIMETFKKIRRILMYKSSFNYPESIEALKRIDEYDDKKREEYKSIDLQIKEISEELSKNCTHPIILEKSLDNECPFCKTVYEYSSDIPETSRYLIENINFDKQRDSIDQIVLNSENEEIASEILMNYFNELQYSDNVKIRRLTK